MLSFFPRLFFYEFKWALLMKVEFIYLFFENLFHLFLGDVMKYEPMGKTSMKRPCVLVIVSPLYLGFTPSQQMYTAHIFWAHF